MPIAYNKQNKNPFTDVFFALFCHSAEVIFNRLMPGGNKKITDS